MYSFRVVKIADIYALKLCERDYCYGYTRDFPVVDGSGKIINTHEHSNVETGALLYCKTAKKFVITDSNVWAQDCIHLKRHKDFAIQIDDDFLLCYFNNRSDEIGEFVKTKCLGEYALIIPSIEIQKTYAENVSKMIDDVASYEKNIKIYKQKIEKCEEEITKLNNKKKNLFSNQSFFNMEYISRSSTSKKRSNDEADETNVKKTKVDTSHINWNDVII